MKRLLLSLLTGVAVAAPVALPQTALAAPDQKTIVTFDCGAAGTFQAEGLAWANAVSVQILDSDQYHAMVGHAFWVNGQLVYENAVKGNEGPLYTCTSQQGPYTVVALVQLV